VVINYHYHWFVLPTGGDGDPFFTAALCHESAVKITFTNGLTNAVAQ
jgi:hypothetical protein